MRRVARDFADAMLEEHVPGSTLIGKRCARRAAVLPPPPPSPLLPFALSYHALPAPHPSHKVAFSPPSFCLS